MPDEIQAPLGHLLRRVYTFAATLAMADGPRSREFVVLDALAQEDARSQHDLAHRLGINRTLMVKVLDGLQEAGYLTRTRNPANRRTYVLSLTGPGRQALADLREAAADRDAQITAALTPAQRHRLNELLTRLLPEPERPALPSTAHLITQAHLRMRALGDRFLDPYGLRTRHFLLLPALERLGPCPQQTLARAVDLTEPATASVVEELVQAGLVARGQDPHDRRRHALELTDLGRSTIPAVRQAQHRMTAATTELLGQDGTAELQALLSALLADASAEVPVSEQAL
ncbi:DNA-binding transcriptional regulator, MarR family [Nonomuraea solani]|uniref:DNA-binding transcriptional regulator, MarR family n=1 Tax=Nonomuraea solani TaxID=1144553 RepID=A0A1H5YAE2_9ACTN|nr:MarR family transcriptional regulator [Nonomuraea solani]SEG21033.1 DNA-binding transcriptional regulator, MarR family [Nonomuraea solani]